MGGGAWQAMVHGVAELDTTEWTCPCIGVTPRGSCCGSQLCLGSMPRWPGARKNPQLNFSLGLPGSEVFPVVPDPGEGVHLATHLPERGTKDPVPGLSGILTVKQPRTVLHINLTAVVILCPVSVTNCRSWIWWVFLATGFLFNHHLFISVHLCSMQYSKWIASPEAWSPKNFTPVPQHAAQYTDWRIFHAPPTLPKKLPETGASPKRWGVLSGLSYGTTLVPQQTSRTWPLYVFPTCCSTHDMGEKKSRGLASVMLQCHLCINSTETTKNYDRAGMKGAPMMQIPKSSRNKRRDVGVMIWDSGKKGREWSLGIKENPTSGLRGKRDVSAEGRFSKEKPGCCDGRTMDWLLVSWIWLLVSWIWLLAARSSSYSLLQKQDTSENQSGPWLTFGSMRLGLSDGGNVH